MSAWKVNLSHRLVLVGIRSTRRPPVRKGTSRPPKRRAPVTRVSSSRSTCATGRSCGSAAASTVWFTSPPGDHEDLVVLWLWSERTGVFSHETALALHQLSDAMPADIHMTLPASWGPRRLRIPAGLSAHFDDLGDAEWTWAGAVRVTTPARTINDCALDLAEPELVAQAARESERRGLIAGPEIQPARAYLSSFGVEMP